MIQAFHKTRSRAGLFVSGALAWRGPDRQYALVAWSLVGGAVWFASLLPTDPTWYGFVLAGLFLLTIITVVCAIDARYGIIPDNLVIALAIGGLLQCGLAPQADYVARACEASVFLGGTYLFQRSYFWLRGYDGLGLGDVKFATAAVLWVGLENMPLLLLFAVLSAAASLVILKRDGHELGGQHAIAFGPHLAAALWLVWIGVDHI